MTIDRTDYVHAITARTETVTAAKAKAVQAAADEARYRGLVKTGAVSASTYDQIKAASDAAQAELAAAEAQEQVARDEVLAAGEEDALDAALGLLHPGLRLGAGDDHDVPRRHPDDAQRDDAGSALRLGPASSGVGTMLVHRRRR